MLDSKCGASQVITFLSALIVSHVVADGETNWLEGYMLLMVLVAPLPLASISSQRHAQLLSSEAR